MPLLGMLAKLEEGSRLERNSGHLACLALWPHLTQSDRTLNEPPECAGQSQRKVNSLS